MNEACCERNSAASSFLSKRLRQAREEKGLSQRQLARATGITKSYVCMIERGVVLSVSCGVLRSLSLATGVSCDWLLGVSDERAAAEEAAAPCAKDKRELMESLRESLEEVDDLLRRALEGEKDARQLRDAARDAKFYMADILLDMDELIGAT